MKADFYDIESLDNAFTLCNYRPYEDSVDVYYLVDNENLVSDPNFRKNVTDRIHEKNKNFTGAVNFYDLRTKGANYKMAETFGCSDAYQINDPDAISSYPPSFRLVCDTDPGFDDEKYPYYMGYNSYNYDTTMLALYFHEVFPIVETHDGERGSVFEQTSAELMRHYNDELFLSMFKDSMPNRLLTTFDETRRSWTNNDYNDIRYRIRKNMMLSGRHLDVARLNEKLLKVGLKRLLGMTGLQILESDKLSQNMSHLDTADQFYDLIAYNVSDTVNLKALFDMPFYQAQFANKKGLLSTYPELIYTKQRSEYKPEISPKTVRKNRLTIDSSSAQFAANCLCPYDHLTDLPAVSFMFPSEQKSKELGIPRVNVLDEARKFFYDNFPQPELRETFDKVYRYYKAIEGKNFNSSKAYYADHVPAGTYIEPSSLSDIPKDENCMFYYNKDGSPSSCFVTFSVGGIHGAEYNKTLFDKDMAAYEELEDMFDYVQRTYPDPIDLKKAKKVTLPNGETKTAGFFLKTGSTLKSAAYKSIGSKKPKLFKTMDDGSTKLNPNYVYTSAEPSIHEDFKSYYPNLLIMLMALYNKGLGYDRYAEIFDNKELYGKYMKDKNRTEKERDLYSILREGTKLILNSASGAADASYDTSIRANNFILSMRIIGQLFTWRIGQAQTLEGARIISTNTDGLYSVLEETKNNAILAREAKNIGVIIEPEPIYLISKDSNNRLEINPKTGDIESASGGTLACRKGPNVTKSLAHPAIIDWALAEYLIVAAAHHKGLSLDKEFDRETGLNILKSARLQFEPVKYLQMFQNIIASSVSSMNYVFGINPETQDLKIMQHYNRVFIMKDTPENRSTCYNLYAANARVITASTKKKRAAADERERQHDPVAVQVFSAHGVKLSDIPNEREVIVKKVTNVESEWNMFIENRNLSELSPEEVNKLVNNLDIEKYLQLVQDCYERNWRNMLEPKTTKHAAKSEDKEEVKIELKRTQEEPAKDEKTETASAEPGANEELKIEVTPEEPTENKESENEVTAEGTKIETAPEETAVNEEPKAETTSEEPEVDPNEVPFDVDMPAEQIAIDNQAESESTAETAVAETAVAETAVAETAVAETAVAETAVAET